MTGRQDASPRLAIVNSDFPNMNKMENHATKLPDTAHSCAEFHCLLCNTGKLVLNSATRVTPRLSSGASPANQVCTFDTKASRAYKCETPIYPPASTHYSTRLLDGRDYQPTDFVTPSFIAAYLTMKLSFLLPSLFVLAAAKPLVSPPTPQCVAIAGDPCDGPDSGALQCCGGYQCQPVRSFASEKVAWWNRKADFVRVLEKRQLGLCGLVVGEKRAASLAGGGAQYRCMEFSVETEFKLGRRKGEIRSLNL